MRLSDRWTSCGSADRSASRARGHARGGPSRAGHYVHHVCCGAAIAPAPGTVADDETPSVNHRRLRRLRGARLAVAIVCLLAVLTFVAIQTPPFRRFAVNQVVALLARENIEFSTDELGYNLLGASFNLRNVRIRSTTWPDAPVFATVGRLRIDMSLVQLLRGRYVVQSGTIEDVDVHYVVDEQGRDNLPRPP